jgi:DNA polymerase-3 subunit alpha
VGGSQSKGVIPYMTLVGDISRWARARRSGQLPWLRRRLPHLYLVGIVNIDPISWGLLFERFLNPERKGLPDIDLDVASDRRARSRSMSRRRSGATSAASTTTARITSPTSSRTRAFSPRA